MVRRSSQSRRHIGLFHVAGAGLDQVSPERQLLHDHPVIAIDARLVRRFDGDEHKNIVEDAIVLQIMHERAWRKDRIGLQEDRSTRNSRGRTALK